MAGINARPQCNLTIFPGVTPTRQNMTLRKNGRHRAHLRCWMKQQPLELCSTRERTRKKYVQARHVFEAKHFRKGDRKDEAMLREPNIKTYQKLGAPFALHILVIMSSRNGAFPEAPNSFSLCLPKVGVGREQPKQLDAIAKNILPSHGGVVLG